MAKPLSVPNARKLILRILAKGPKTVDQIYDSMPPHAKNSPKIRDVMAKALRQLHSGNDVGMDKDFKYFKK